MKSKKMLLIVSIFVMLFASCGKVRKAGTYEGIGQGRNGDIKVSVVINSNGKIEDIVILEHSENKEFIKASYPILKKLMIENNSHDVDIVAGSTDTSDGIIEAVENALNQSK